MIYCQFKLHWNNCFELLTFTTLEWCETWWQIIFTSRQYPHVQTGYTNITRWLYARWCYMFIVCAHTL